MTLTLDESGILERQLTLGVSRAQQELRAAHCPHTEIALNSLMCCPMSTISAEDLGDDGDLVAGSALRFGGEFSGSALFAMQPPAALEVARASDDASDPIRCFVRFGERIASEVVSAIAAGLSAQVDVGPGSLAEDTVAAILFGTHAPPDTMIVVTQLHTSCEPDGVPLPGYLYLLFEPKTLEALLAVRA